jgi:cell division septation protein DedD
VVDSATRKYVFISHASQDAAQAREIVDHLEKAGINCWIAPRNVRPGKNFSLELNEALENAGAFIICVSSSANSSPYVRVETEKAFPRCPIFPVRTEAVVPSGGLALYVSSNQWIDAFGNDRADNLNNRARELGSVFEQVVVRPHTPPEPSDPTGGPLSEEEALRTFIGPNAHRYIWSWRSQDSRKSVIGWHFPAFFLGPFWLGYRKLFAWAGAYLAAYLVLGSFSVAGSIKHDESLTTLSGLGLWAMNIFLALRASNLYRLHCQQRVAEINRPGNDRQSVIDQLMLGGRVSWWAALGALALYFVVIGTVAAVVSNNLDKTDTTISDDGTDNNMVAADDNNMTPVDNTTAADTTTPTDTSTPVSPPPVVNPTPATTGYYIFCVENRTPDKVNFEISYGDSTDWTRIALDAQENKILWYEGSDTPHIRFDYILSDTDVTYRNYDLASVYSADHSQCGTSNYYFKSSDSELDLLKTNN